ncbi:hypothetical protein V6N13_080798 [Hibiscus sabdariffa]|uniref:Inosine/uridine-preferring nucleoside hydrolase domain-containing protein n=1 Tax=Hibiscus sabdariffa TaxID=183260 RepID=A0ABR2CCZ8_9ROSI
MGSSRDWKLGSFDTLVDPDDDRRPHRILVDTDVDTDDTIQFAGEAVKVAFCLMALSTHNCLVRPNCLKNDGSDHSRECSDIGNLYLQDSNPYAEFNMFSNPFAAYKVLHSGVPFTLIPLDATNTILVRVSSWSLRGDKRLRRH